MSDVFFELGVDDAPECSLLRDPRTMLRVEEGDVEHFLRIVAPMVTNFQMLEVRVLHIARLLELFNIYVSLGNGSLPTIVGQRDAVAEAFY